MELHLGLDDSEAFAEGPRGTTQGFQMRSMDGWAGGDNGDNSSGFAGRPGGYKNPSGVSKFSGIYGFWWTTTLAENEGRHRGLHNATDQVLRGTYNRAGGLSIRCIQDSEQ